MFTFEDWMGRPLLKKIHKSPVVDEPAASQCSVDEVFLFSVRVDPEFDSFLHYPILSFCLCDVFWFSIYCFTVSSGAPPTVDTK